MNKIEFSYDSSLRPSGYVLDIIVKSQDGKIKKQKGKIDTGSDGIAISESLVHELDLKPHGKIKVSDVNGNSFIRKTYDVFIQIQSIRFDLVSVVATPRDNVLIGRNLINLWEMKLDGQNHKGEIIPWSTNPDDAM